MVASTTAESSDGANASATAEASSQQYSVAGDLISIATGLCLASFLVSSRWAAAVLPDVALSTTPVVANTAVSVCMLPLLLTEFARVGAPEALFWAALALDGACLAVAFNCIVLASKHASSAEVGIVLLVENILGPVWVYLGFGEVPGRWTLIGGALLLSTLASHETFHLMRSPKAGIDTDAPGAEADDKAAPEADEVTGDEASDGLA